MNEPLSKQDVRERVWRALQIHGAARFPGAKGRIPNFPGAEAAARQYGTGLNIGARSAYCDISFPDWQ